ncbi:hypothetical protein LPJ61_002192 [Coemansia biformis]|uniref:C2H2-type domain-containing protein n=1 Tax=Coemansia biformis TaxID=1286918 RepID=A0A9W7YCY4_9FUNG|nr:hypothetical protein LPJ61_002192 [Coemansia biformis]
MSGVSAAECPDVALNDEGFPARLLSRSLTSRRRTSVRRARTHGLRPHSIARVDVPPALDTSIQVIDSLFKQYRQCGNSRSDYHDDGGDSPTSLVPSAHSSLDSEGTLAEPLAADYPRIHHGLLAMPAVEHGGDPGDADSTCQDPSEPLPEIASHDANCTQLNSHLSLCDESEPPQLLFSRLMDALFPWPQPEAEQYHLYYVVATMDGQPAISRQYACPTAMCAGRFAHFEELQLHWPTHPWNRRGVLLPVAAGGIRRLTFWQHKAVYIRSLLHGPHAVDPAAGHVPASVERCRSRRNWLGEANRHPPARLRMASAMAISDYGDIRLFGPKSYFVLPRIVPIEQVRMWEERLALQAS